MLQKNMFFFFTILFMQGLLNASNAASNGYIDNSTTVEDHSHNLAVQRKKSKFRDEENNYDANPAQRPLPVARNLFGSNNNNNNNNDVQIGTLFEE